MRIYKRNDTEKINWAYDIRHEGKRYRKSSFKTKSEAKAHAEQLIVDLSKGLVQKNNIVAHKYIKTWIEVNKEPHLKDVSLKRYYLAHRIFKEHFGDTKLKDVTRQEFQLMLNNYAVGKTKDTVKKLRECLSGAFKDATYERLIDVDPTYKLTNTGNKPKMKEDEKYTTLTMYKKLIQEFKNGNSESSIMLLIMALTGARYGEVARLKRTDIHPTFIHLPGTKTETSERDVRISTEDIKLIKRKINSLPININGYIFKNSNAAVNKTLRSTLKRLNAADDEYITSHGLRHTHASFLISEDIPIEYISKRLGHKSISITLEVYAHLLEEAKHRHDEKVLKIL